MAATKGNQFWKQRSKHGRDKLFQTPELLWDAACEYFQWCDENPLIAVEHDKLKVNGEGDRLIMVELPKMRPYTIQGLCLYLDVNNQYLNDFEGSLKDNPNKDFSSVITRIKETIYTQKFEGAASGFFNPNIIARDLGLSDKSETKIQVEQPLFGDGEK